MKSHKDLTVYQEALNYVELIYKLTADFPENEKFGLVSQLRRASVSVVSNIAEGAARQSQKEFVQFLYIALGSLSEIEAQTEISERLGFLKDTTLLSDKNIYIRRMLLKLIDSIKNK
nr:four helix bundle protein [uncultured Flavobacterium sp.]